uniref:PPFIA binding protein 1 n=1 Tax=Catharus ustulatus TaxID=91951 RepID=A0A8C3U369_CATUS
MMSDASDMLAAALEQMDGIIAGSKALEYSNGIFDCQSPTSPFMGGLRALHLVEDLRGLLEMMEAEEREGLRCQVPDSTAEALIEWLQSQMTNGHISGNGDVYQERLARLENDKESLELLSRTTLETQKLDLMAEISTLKLKLTSVEKDRLDYEDRFRDTEDLIQEINELRLRVGEMDNERLQYEKKLKTTKDELSALKDKLEQKEAEVKRLHEKLVCKLKGEGIEILDRDIEVQKMKKAVESLMAANEEKDRKIEELRQSLNRYKKVQDMVILAQGKESENEDLNSGSVSTGLLDTPSLADPEKSPSPTPVTASPIHDEFNVNIHEEVGFVLVFWGFFVYLMPSFLENTACAEVILQMTNLRLPKRFFFLGFTVFCNVSYPFGESSFLVKAQGKPPVEGNNFATLPPKSPSHGGTGDEDSFGTRKARSSFGRGFFKIKNNKRTASAPNLAETEKGSADHLDLAGLPPRPKEADSLQMTPPSPDSRKKARGIKKLFGRLKRSQSTTFNPEDMSETEFKRGGTRATAGPRLGWSRDLGQSHNELDMPFAKWTKEQVCNWLQDQGLGSYINNGRHWILSGQTLLQASQQDLEKELGIKHPLHRKKLQLALQALGSEEENNHGKLDYHWVTRWLDDIGLPQYKTQFDEGKVDGRMLHYMTVDDLLSLKVISVLHHLSIKRAIQVLRINNFEPNCLRRRPSDENNVTPSEVTQWTNHRVMEWLRSVDLAEYAPNLRGSGVHGGLMVLEPRFNVETMAQLLNIPPNKTLLRRHLATHFNLLVGQGAQQQKRETMESPDYVLLTATAKVKPKKLTFSNFGSLRKKRQDDVEEYVCPMELGRASGSGSKKGFKPGLDIRVYDDDDLDRLEQMEDSEGTVRQIGAFSEGINNLTVSLCVGSVQ